MIYKRIEANQPKGGLRLLEVFQYRRLMLALAYRDLKVQYAQTILGLLWTMAQPLTAIVVFSLLFGYLIKVDTGEAPYPLFALAGLAGWTYFNSLLTQAGSSLLQSQSIIKKIYFPRLILPFSKLFVALPDLLVSLSLLTVASLVWRHTLPWTIVFLPIFILLNTLTGLSVGLWLSALTVRYRDFYQIIPYAVNTLVWLTPVFYPTTIIPENYRFLLYFNPMAGVIAGYRWCLVGADAPSVYYAIGFVPVLILFLTGAWYFRKIERILVDLI